MITPAGVDLGSTAPDARHAAAVERPTASASLLDAVADLRRDVALTRFPLPVPGADEAEDARRRLLDQLDDHLLPRLRELSAPAVVVVAGSTGAGKSTLVNSLLGTEVSAAGVLRPTTRRPVMVHHPADGELLTDHPLRSMLDVVVNDRVPRGIALVDAPDLDSLLESNRSTAHRLLEAADLWVFVTTATRYGDALPWAVLARAAERGTSIAMVLNRVSRDALGPVRTDLLGRLRERGMSSVPLFLVPDAGPHEGLLPAATVAPVLRWLTMVAGPDRARAVIARTQRGALQALRPWVDELAEAVQAQVDARAGIERLVAEVRDRAAGAAERDVTHVAEGPVRSRWVAASTVDGPLAGRWGRRGTMRRTEALEELRRLLRSSAAVVLTAARRRGERAIADALADSSLPGADGVPAMLVPAEGQAEGQEEPTPTGGPSRGRHTGGPAAGEHAPAVDPGQAADEWARFADQAVEELAAADPGTSRRLARLARLGGPEGPATVVLAAAAGLGAARATLTEALGSLPTEDVVRRVRDDLVRRAADQVRAGGDPVLDALHGPHLADDAASRLRLRLAVLKGLT